MSGSFLREGKGSHLTNTELSVLGYSISGSI